MFATINPMTKLSNFEFEGQLLPTKFEETQTVKEGVECDIYSFIDDKSKDLAIVRVARGHKTPLQRIRQGNRTVEGFMSGKGCADCTDRGPDEDL